MFDRICNTDAHILVAAYIIRQSELIAVLVRHTEDHGLNKNVILVVAGRFFISLKKRFYVMGTKIMAAKAQGIKSLALSLIPRILIWGFTHRYVHINSLIKISQKF